MKPISHRVVLALGLSISAVSLSAVATAADLEAGRLPAVSAVNGKLEIGGGWADIDSLGSDEVLFAAASLSIPLGERMGFQGDLNISNWYDDTAVSANGHLFTRDPSSYLLGVIGGYGSNGSVNLAWVGPEAELYLNSLSVELAGGYVNVDPDWASAHGEAFVFADLGFYATENLRFTLGGSSIAKFESAHLGLEWMPEAIGMPVSFKLDGQVGEDDYQAVTASVSFYFGGDKSLMRRHREDDPRNRALDMFGAGSHGPGAPAACVPSAENYYCEDVIE